MIPKGYDKLIVLMALGFMWIMPDLLNAQPINVDLDLSRYYFRMDGSRIGVIEYNKNEHCGMFPNGSYYMWTVSNIKEGLLFGNIILANGEMKQKYREKLTGGYYHEPPFGVYIISKYAPPEVYVNGLKASPEYTGLVDETIKADKMFRIYKKESPWMHLVYEGYQFVNQYYGDFTILNTNYKLTFDDDDVPGIAPDTDADTTQTVKDFYITKGYRIGQTSYTGKAALDPNRDWFVHYGAWWTSTMEVESVVSGNDRNKLIVTYGWDDDHPQLMSFTPGGTLFDDTGEPRWKPVPDGNLTSTPYSGFTLLHCDKSPQDKSDWIENQPYGSRVYVNFTSERGDAQWPGGKTAWDYLIAPGPGIYELAAIETDPNADPQQLLGKQPVQVWGGWPEMRKDDSVRIVHALGAGSISRKEAREVGAAWASWYQFGDVPEAHYNDRVLGDVLVTDAIKNQIIARGKDSLALAMQRAQELWENDLNCPRPYPSPDLFISAGPNSIQLEWHDVEEDFPDHEGGNVTSYRIYRKIGYLPDEYPTEAGRDRYWHIVIELSVTSLTKNANGMYEHIDKGLSVGENYFYAVTAVSDIRAGIDGTGPFLESSKWSNRSQLPSVPFVSTNSIMDNVVVMPNPNYVDSVVVIPNPYYIRGQLMNFASNNNRLMFANLPSVCTMKIYNVTGDLIHSINHNSGTSTEFWDQITIENQYIVSGVYILVITNAQKLVKNESGVLVPEKISGKSMVKFTIIR